MSVSFPHLSNLNEKIADEFIRDINQYFQRGDKVEAVVIQVLRVVSALIPAAKLEDDYLLFSCLKGRSSEASGEFQHQAGEEETRNERRHE